MESNQTSSHSCNGNRTLVIMAKAPRPGAVKTRLAHSLSVNAATELYRCLLHDTLALAHSLSGVKVAIMCPASDVEDMQQLAGSDTIVAAQDGAGLAAALTSVFAHFAAPAESRVIAFNSDSPHLPGSVACGRVRDARRSRLGCGTDARRGLLSSRSKSGSCMGFSPVTRWGRTSAFDALLARARRLRLAVGFTERFYDIDVGGDLTQLAAELRVTPARAPRTAAWLKERRPLESPSEARAGEP